jgi:hypothetical protein
MFLFFFHAANSMWICERLCWRSVHLEHVCCRKTVSFSCLQQTLIEVDLSKLIENFVAVKRKAMIMLFSRDIVEDGDGRWDERYITLPCNLRLWDFHHQTNFFHPSLRYYLYLQRSNKPSTSQKHNRTSINNNASPPQQPHPQPRYHPSTLHDYPPLPLCQPSRWLCPPWSCKFETLIPRFLLPTPETKKYGRQQILMLWGKQVMFATRQCSCGRYVIAGKRCPCGVQNWMIPTSLLSCVLEWSWSLAVSLVGELKNHLVLILWCIEGESRTLMEVCHGRDWDGADMRVCSSLCSFVFGVDALTVFALVYSQLFVSNSSAEVSWCLVFLFTYLYR